MSKIHPYLPNSVPDIKKKMMNDIGVSSIADLYSDIPDELVFKGELKITGPLSEAEVKQHVVETLEENNSLKAPPFLGGGVWPHYVPSVVDEVVHRAEFLTSYTPYQPEISQGILQSMFEYQSLLSELVSMEVTNASLYDWATATGEAALMTGRITRRTEVLVPDMMSPQRLSVLETYTEPAGLRIVKVAHEDETGLMDMEDLKAKISKDTASVYVENPAYMGFVEKNVESIGEVAHDNDSIYIVGVDPTSLGVLTPPGKYDADIVCGEGQPLGNHMSWGGPLLGILSCKHENRFIRQMPGRIIGLTETIQDQRRAYVMTLATREQHIRREKATSNICSNQALNALAAGVYLSLMGPTGMRRLGEGIIKRSKYAQDKINSIPSVDAPLFKGFHFKEFTVRIRRGTLENVHKHLLSNGFEAGIPLKRDFSWLGETSLYCVTEVHTKKQIDSLVSKLREAVQ
jgi:glycine dehydrogenase subunit 1